MNEPQRVEAYEIEQFSMLPTFVRYQHLSQRAAVYPGQGTAMGLNYTLLKLNEEAGEAAKQFAKALRDDGMDHKCLHLHASDKLLQGHRQKALVKELGDVLWYIAAAAKELNMSVEDIARINLIKIAGRVERGTVHGDGDER